MVICINSNQQKMFIKIHEKSFINLQSFTKPFTLLMHWQKIICSTAQTGQARSVEYKFAVIVRMSYYYS